MEVNVINQKIQENSFALYQGDSCQIIKGIPEDSIDYTIFSPPFASLYTYSNSNYDMGNCKSDDEFYKHFEFLVKDMFRVTKPGRLLSFHCMNLPTLKSKDGYIGIKDFRGDMIRLFTDNNWIYHSEVCIWKDPVTAMQRTKALGLLHKQVMKDSCMSRQGIADYIVTMRKPGKNPDPVSGCFNSYTGEDEEPTDEFVGNFEPLNRYSINVWQRYASPVWSDIRQNHTLNKNSARNEDDVKHLCPLQLDVVDRCLELWTNPGDVVFSPFLGIGTEGYCSVKMGRKFIGVELKSDYFREACHNIENSDIDLTQKEKPKSKVKKTKEGDLIPMPVNNVNLDDVLPKSRSELVFPSSKVYLKIFGENDTIENHFAKIHRSETGFPTSYKDLKHFKDQTKWKIGVNTYVGLDDHKSEYNFGLQAYAALWYKWIRIEDNMGQLKQLISSGLPRVFLEDPEMSKIDMTKLIDDKAGLLAITQELREKLEDAKKK